MALGVGAIVLLIVRRRQEKADDAANPVPPMPGGPRGPVPAARGAYHGAGDDATRVAGAGMAGDRTMMGRPGLADAPTMLQAPVRDEYADPYGVPPGVTPVGPPTQGYGAAQPGWGAASGGYSDATQVGGYPGAAGSPAGYGAAAPTGYGAGGPRPPGRRLRSGCPGRLRPPFQRSSEFPRRLRPGRRPGTLRQPRRSARRLRRPAGR